MVFKMTKKQTKATHVNNFALKFCGLGNLPREVFKISEKSGISCLVLSVILTVNHIELQCYTSWKTFQNNYK
jgi:hypothetical protein